MGTRAKISLLGLYNWDDTIFDNFLIPSELNKDELVNNLLMELAELSVIYPDSEFIKKAIASWSAIRLHTWERMTMVLYENYEPFINIKRDEVRTIIQERDLQGTNNLNSDTNLKVNAWETETPQDKEMTNTDSSSSSTDTGTVTTTETFHVEGDSAITDAQDVLKKELDVRIKYDMYRLIIDEFKNRFCLLIY